MNDNRGGAAIASYRLHRGLIEQGHFSRMLVLNKNINDDTILKPIGKSRKLINLFSQRFDNYLLKFQKSPNPNYHSLNLLPNGFVNQINSLDIDIVHLHWVSKGMLPIIEIPRIKKPIVWTLHDSWPFCGSEHHDDITSPGRYINGYNVYNRSSRHRWLDLDKIVWKYKKKCWQNTQISIIAPSKWMANCAKNSVLFKNYPIQVIPNGININRYKPIDRSVSREVLGIPQDTLLLLFGAVSPTKTEIKGSHLLKEALIRLKKSNIEQKIALAVFGTEINESLSDFGFKTYNMGYLHDDYSKSILYSASNIFLTPSIQDNLPCTIMESLACGTPVVAFDIGGIPDMVDHKINGYLAKENDPDDLAKGISWIIDNQSKIDFTKQACLKVKQEFRIDKIADQHFELYSEILSGQRLKN